MKTYSCRCGKTSKVAQTILSWSLEKQFLDEVIDSCPSCNPVHVGFTERTEVTTIDEPATFEQTPEQPIKRGRGRPRKNPV